MTEECKVSVRRPLVRSQTGLAAWLVSKPGVNRCLCPLSRGSSYLWKAGAQNEMWLWFSKILLFPPSTPPPIFSFSFFFLFFFFLSFFLERPARSSEVRITRVDRQSQHLGLKPWRGEGGAGGGGGVVGDGVGGKEGGGRGLKRISAIPTPPLGFGLGRVGKPLSLVYCLRVSSF